MIKLKTFNDALPGLRNMVLEAIYEAVGKARFKEGKVSSKSDRYTPLVQEPSVRRYHI